MKIEIEIPKLIRYKILEAGFELLSEDEKQLLAKSINQGIVKQLKDSL